MSVQLSQKSTKELVVMYNSAAQKLGRKPVARFSDLKTALRRTREILEVAPADTLELKPTKGRKTRGFNFPVKDVKPLRQGTLRAAIRDAMEESSAEGKGLTFEQIKKVVEKFDKKHDLEPYDVDIRAYEATRLLHFYCGYGMSQPEQDGPITLLSKKQ